MIPWLWLLLFSLQDAAPLRPFDDAMEAQLREYRIPGGALAVVRDGRLILAKGYGLADVDAKTPVDAASLFRIASISKPVTAVAVLRLVQEGRLDLDAKAFGLLELKPEGADGRLAQITIRQLLQHTGGWDREKSGDPMFRPFDIASEAGVAPPPGPAVIMEFVAKRRLDFDPGARHAYSNFGYCVLGRVIEKVSGQPYEDYVRKTVLTPMGITRMRLGKTLLDQRAEGEVRYYPVTGLQARPVFAAIPEKQVPWPYGGFYLEAMDAHGGWLASASDLVRFVVSLDKVLDAKTQATMLARPPGLDPVSAYYYACGWMVRPMGKEGRMNVWHNGSLPGTSTLLVRRHDGLVWAALFNDRSRGEGKIDPALHIAADAVKEWPTVDLFEATR
ncbi:MAG TPA: serine hydrolase domain-containing protein [Planctomycetota bacterium]|nr:serine hydrolase domain-containing protein [Planctomycetota bacterium]